LKLKWVIESRDVEKVKQFVARAESDPSVQRRRQRNFGQPRPRVSRTGAWKVIVGCLLTTQQKSGPGKPVDRFLRVAPFRLAYSHCLRRPQKKKFISETLSAFGGIRRSSTIATQLVANLALLEEGQWETLLAAAVRVDAANDATVERSAAHYIADTFHGFGPKQSRNFLQWLGVSRYEIPIDSRITKWLNSELLDFELNAAMLAEAAYYDMVSDGIIELCRRSGTTPCIFDAAVFSSFDRVSRSDADLAARPQRGRS